MPFEVWIYGTPPEEVDFVRINGNRVIQMEIAKEGQPVEVFTKDVVSPMLMSSGTPELAADSSVRIVKEGDVERDPNKEAPDAPPSLRNPGEKLPTDNQNEGVMRPVQFPKPHPDEMPGANPDEQTSTPPPSGQPSQPGKGQAGSQTGSGQGTVQNPQDAPPSGSQQPAAPPAKSTPPANGQGQPPAGSNQLVSTAKGGAETN